MSDFLWRLLADDNEALRETETFPSKEDAEAWLGREWAALLEEGAESVELITDGRVLYRMGLREA